MRIDVQVVVFYEDDDPGFEGDYNSILILVNDHVVKEYGDDYHDSGRDKTEGFLDCLLSVYPEAKIRWDSQPISSGPESAKLYSVSEAILKD